MSEAKQELFRLNATAYWASTVQPNTMSGDYQLDLCNLSGGAVRKLEEVGVEPKTGEEKREVQGQYVTAKSKFPIKVYDNDGNELKGVKIGNGSKVIATVRPFSWTFKNKKGISLGVLKLVVTELIEYEGNDAPLIDDTDDIPF